MYAPLLCGCSSYTPILIKKQIGNDVDTSSHSIIYQQNYVLYTTNKWILY